MSKFNRLGNTKNKFQGGYKKVLCVCSAGLLRSPTAALVLSQEPFNFNTRACGAVSDFALICLDEILLEWADEVVCMEKEMAEGIREHTKKPVICLEIEDSYAYRDPELMKLIREKYEAQNANN